MGKGSIAVYIHELQAKLKGLGDTLAEVAETAEIKPNSLKGDANPNRSMLSEENQLKIATAYGFSIDWEEWRDKRFGDPSRWNSRQEKEKQAEAQARLDSAEQFRFRRLHGPPLKLKTGATACLDKNLADLHVAPLKAPGSNFVLDEFMLAEEVSSEPIDVPEGGSIGLRSWRVFYDLPERDGVILSEVEAASRDGVKIARDGGTAQRPRYRYEVEKPPMRGRIAPTKPVGRYFGASAGDQIEVRVIANLRDCFVEGRRGTHLGPPKREKLRDHLRRLWALGKVHEPSDGSETLPDNVTLALQILTVEENRGRG